MAPTEIETRIIEIIRVRRPDFSFETVLGTPFTELGVDSIELLNLVFEIEEEFGISITTDDLRKVRTTAELARLVRSIIAATGSNNSRP